MAGAGTKWAIGCGIGCAVILLAAVAAGVAGALFVRDTLKGFDAAVQVRGDLDRRFGRADAFTPWPDGAIPAERIEAFLAVREATARARGQLAAKFAAIPLSQSEARELEAKPAVQKALSVFRIIGSALGLGAELGDFFEARNRALLDGDMGMGEYTYLYVLLYYGGLGRSPADGPGSHDDHAVDVNIGNVAARRRIHDDLLSMLRNQMQELSADVAEEWREALAAEIAVLERDIRRIPWQDGLPVATAASLEPFRDRLESSYDPSSNPFELTITRKKGLSVSAE